MSRSARDMMSRDGRMDAGHTSRVSVLTCPPAPARRVRIAASIANGLAAITVVAALTAAGLSFRNLGGIEVVSAEWLGGLVGAFAYALPGAYLAARRPGNAVGWLFLTIGMAYAIADLSAAYGTYGLETTPGSLPAASWARWLGLWVWSVAYGLIPSLLLLVVPTGKLLSKRWRPVAWFAGAGVVVLAGAWALTPYGARDAVVSMPEVTNPVGVSWGPSLFLVAGPLLIVGVIGGLLSLGIRYRRADAEEREQVSWVLFGAGLAVTLLVAARLLPYDGPGQYVGALALVPLPLCIAVAVFRHGMWDVSAALSRSILYAGLTLGVIAVYVAVVTVVGGLLGRTTGAPVFAVAIVAVVASPLRDRLRRVANRLVYGVREEPWMLISHLSDRLRDNGRQTDLFQGVADTIARAFRLPHAAIEREGAELGAFGTRAGALWRLPLAHGGEVVGELVVSDPRKRLTDTDRRVLQDLAPQLAVAIQAASLTDELERSRERILVAREEERRRLRRELHDGVGPTLAAVALGLESVRKRLHTNPQLADTQLDRLGGHLNGVVGDVRHIVEDLRPAELEDLGLLAALRQQAERFQTDERSIELDTRGSLDNLPAAVDLALLRIASKALSNAARHSGGRRIRMRLHRDNTHVELSIRDDGAGIDPTVRTGHGSNTMRERATELGGTLEIDSNAPRHLRPRARPGAAPMRIVVADDHPLYREGLVEALGQLPHAEVVSEAATGSEALAAVAEHEPDLVIMDLHMPEMNGLDATKAIVSQHPTTAVLVLTMLEDDSTLLAALRAGARGYLVKGATRAEIMRAVEAVADGQVILGGESATRLAHNLTEGAAHNAPFPTLTEREREILELVTRGLTNPAIASRLYLSEKTVRNYVSNILSKLHVTSRGAAIAKARDAGFGTARTP